MPTFQIQNYFVSRQRPRKLGCQEKLKSMERINDNISGRLCRKQTTTVSSVQFHQDAKNQFENRIFSHNIPFSGKKNHQTLKNI
jgi:hypothetical protein